MGSNRTIQTLLQAIMVVLLAALVYRAGGFGKRGGGGGGEFQDAPAVPPDDVIVKRFRAYFEEDEEARAKVEGLAVSVKGISVEGPVAYVKLELQFRWEGHPPPTRYSEGPLKNAPGKRGDRVQYTEVFKFRRWTTGTATDWDIEGRREPPIIR